MPSRDIARDLNVVNPEIFKSLSPDTRSTTQLSQRYSLFRAKNRHFGANEDAPSFYSDHGLHSFARFLLDPRDNDIVDPATLIKTAQERRLQLVYLRRDIKAVANSLVHFLVDGKSRLIRIPDMAQATRLACECYIPVLARLVRRWTPYLNHPEVLALRFEDLLERPWPIVRDVCERAGMSVTAPDAVREASQQKSWTYRVDQTARWTETFSASQQRELHRIEATLDEY